MNPITEINVTLLMSCSDCCRYAFGVLMLNTVHPPANDRDYPAGTVFHRRMHDYLQEINPCNARFEFSAESESHSLFAVDVQVAAEPELRRAVAALLVAVPDQRPTAATLQAAPYFATDDWDEWGRLAVGEAVVYDTANHTDSLAHLKRIRVLTNVCGSQRLTQSYVCGFSGTKTAAERYWKQVIRWACRS